MKDTPTPEKKDEVNEWKDLLDKAATDFARNHKDGEVRRMFGHHYRSFVDGAIWENNRIESELTKLREENTRLEKAEVEWFKQCNELRESFANANEVMQDDAKDYQDQIQQLREENERLKNELLAKTGF